MANKRRVSFRATKIVKRPVNVRFRTSDGETVYFKATRAVRVPVRVKFLAKKRRK